MLLTAWASWRHGSEGRAQTLTSPPTVALGTPWAMSHQAGRCGKQLALGMQARRWHLAGSFSPVAPDPSLPVIPPLWGPSPWCGSPWLSLGGGC